MTITDLGSLPYVPARDQWPRRTSAKHIWIVLHSIESGEFPTTAEGCAAYFQNPGNRVASTQFVCDTDSTIRCMGWDMRGASAVGANDEGWHIEQAGFAAQTFDQWRDIYSTRMIETQVAPLVAALCARDSIPVRFVNAAGLKRGEAGITTHAECYKAFGGDVRTDPGEHYPIAALLGLVEKALNPTQPIPPEVPDVVYVKFPDKPAIYSLRADRSGKFWLHEDNAGELTAVGAKVRTLATGDDALDAMWERYPKVGGPFA